MLSLVARHLRSLGLQVIEASEGDAAWELAQEHQPDLVILDVMMPGMSGWEICKRLKSHGSQNGQFSGTGVIMLTGIGENLNEMTSPLFAADAWLNKPFEFTELDARIRETLGRYDKSVPNSAGTGSDGVSAGGEEDDDEPARPAPRPKLAARPKPKAVAKAKPASKKPPPKKKAPAKKKPALKTASKKKPAKKTAAKKPSKRKVAKKTRRR